ncbi:undecaprenyl-phosphate alpha-N-acetylglucosaminyl 1-phosphate transferase, partial [Nocardia elegans]|nr:undecaprenyl-phosphate alpha-N-acetylglucosaminyl 1-phosphate transferase [Nocardia elegans]
YLWVGVLAFGAVGTSLMDRRLVVLLMAGGLVFALVVTAVPGLRRGEAAQRRPPSG